MPTEFIDPAANDPGNDAGQAEQLWRALEATAWELADAYAVSDIESHGHVVQADGVRHYDIAPMVDEREVPGELLDLARAAVGYALARRLFVQHLHRPTLLRKVAR